MLLADENQWKAMRGQPASLPLPALLDTLVGSDPSLLSTIFGLYASFDAPAAFRLARNCDVDLLSEQPQLLVGNLALPPFLSMVFAQMRAEPDRLREWSRVLVTAARSNEAAAVLLAEAAPVAAGLDQQCDRIAERDRWYFQQRARWSAGLRVAELRGLQPSVLTHAMTLTSDEDRRLRKIRKLDALSVSAIKPPGSLVVTVLLVGYYHAVHAVHARLMNIPVAAHTDDLSYYTGMLLLGLVAPDAIRLYRIHMWHGAGPPHGVMR